MSVASTGILAPITRLRGIRAAVIAAEGDGMVIDGTARIGIDVEAVAAFGAALVRRTRVAAEEVIAGAPLVVTVEASGGRLIVASAADLVVAVVADPEAHPGIIRVAARRVAASLPSLLDGG
ncbi:MAG: hypothetical protein ACT4OZ_11420 [Gemmatimonadota bacterium]